MKLLLRNSLIIAKCEDIWMKRANRREHIYFISEDHIHIWKGFLHIRETHILIIDGTSSFSRENSCITSDDNRHFPREFLRFRKVKNVPRMENIKCTESHHMVKCLFSMSFKWISSSVFRIRIMRIRKWHKGKRSQIWDTRALRTQKVCNFQNSFDNIWWKEYSQWHNILYIYVILFLISSSSNRPIVYSKK